MKTTTTIIETFDYALPQWSICPLFNADDSGLDEADIIALKMFETELNQLVADNNGSHYTIDLISEEVYFSHTNDIDSLGNNVYDVKIHIFGQVDSYKVTALEHGLVCALWASCGNNEEPLENDYDISDVTDLGVFRTNLFQFIDTHKDILERNNITAEMCGHDYWLTSCGHGAGFWDRGFGDDGELLSADCTDSYDIYETDNGKLAIS